MPKTTHAGEVAPGTQWYLVVSENHKTLRKGATVVVTEDPTGRNWLVHVNDYTLHDLCVDDGYYYTVLEKEINPQIGNPK